VCVSDVLTRVYVALLTNKPRAATVTAIGDVKCVGLDRERFQVSKIVCVASVCVCFVVVTLVAQRRSACSVRAKTSCVGKQTRTVVSIDVRFVVYLQ
jgi:hypothetical protein